MPLSIQNGAAEKARWNAEMFDALLPGKPLVISKPQGAKDPDWREINAYICHNGVDTLSGLEMAPHYEYISTGDRVRILRYKDMKVELSAKQWHLMWDHVVCPFLHLTAPAAAPDDVEFTALREAWHEVTGIPSPHKDWQFPIGQQIAMLLKQLEHRLRAAHVGRPNSCFECCPFRPVSSAAKPNTKPLTYKKYISKAEAAELVADDLLAQQPPVQLINYDPAIGVALAKRGVKVDRPHEGTLCVVTR